MRVVWEDCRWLNEALAENRLDFVELMESAVKRNPKARYTRMTTLDTLLVLPKEHPCAGREDLSLKDFKDDTLILPSEASSVSARRGLRRASSRSSFMRPTLIRRYFWSS